MLNPFVLKKYAALVLACILSTMSTLVVIMYYGIVWGICAFIVSILISLLLGSVLLSDPFRKLVEGKGMLVFNMDSTGVMEPFIVEVLPPNITGVFRGQQINDSFDRAAVGQLNLPKVGKAWQSNDEDGDYLNIQLTKNQFNSARMGLYSYPVLIWNDNLKTLLTKQFLSDLETKSLAQHGVLYLVRVLQNLSNDVRNFGRYIVDQMKPNKGLMSNWWVWLLILAFVGLFAIMIIPKLIPALSGALGTASSTIGSSTISPMG